MSYQPVVPLAGAAGWQFLSRTREAQQASFEKSAQLRRDADYFAGKIGKVTSAQELVQDRRLLSVALGAFGLEADIGSKAFIQKVLEGGSIESGSLANRLADKRYLQMAEAFGFGDFAVPNTAMSEFADQIVSSYYERRFEAAVGDQRPELRLAMGFSRDLARAIDKQTSNNGKWFAIMGNPSVREVVQKALGLPSSFAGLDIDRQLDGFKLAATRVFGTDKVDELADPKMLEQMVRRFLVRNDASTSATTQKGQLALSLLQAGRRG